MYQGSCKRCFMKLLGGGMFVFSLVTIGLGIADLVLTYQVSCVQLGKCQFLTNGLVLTWVGVAIWAPIPIFFNGIAAIWIASRPAVERSWVCVLSFINSVAFGPVIVVVTSLELVNKDLSGMSSAVNNALSTIEIIICVLGGVLTLHAMAVMYMNCCCTNCIEQGMVEAHSHHQYQHHHYDSPVVVREVETTPSHDIGRLNLWSAQRWIDNGKSAAAHRPSGLCRCATAEMSACKCGCQGGGGGAAAGAAATRPTLIFAHR